ncbi:MAG: DNA mismatch repair protein MutS, partial [Chitinophagaceae bacterium]
MKIFPESAIVQLEFDKVKALLTEYCRGEYAKNKSEHLRIHTRLDFIREELGQSHEYSQILRNSIYFPNDLVFNLAKELRLLEIPGATLSEEQFVSIRRLAYSTESLFRWFDGERKIAHPLLAKLLTITAFEKRIQLMIEEILDEGGQVKDNASDDLERIRMSLFKRRNELRKMFERVIQNLNKQGYLADIEESFINGRKVVAVFAEQKRMVKGILHGESDTRRTSFIEPEETIGLNNEVYSLENEERKEIYRILRDLTTRLSVYSPQLNAYWKITGELDFIQAKARLGIEMQADYPVVTDKAQIHLVNAYHPLLYLYNKKSAKPTIPVSITLDEKNRILVISGPNAGGKTVTMKTVGLIQIMVQSGLLVPVHPSSTLGIFKQIMIHIGDTQSLEFELSTYSSHLRNMKYFMETANGRTLFFIDELGSGSDPNLGGAFAEVIMEELARKHAYGIVTTHYLNLKIMANK